MTTAVLSFALAACSGDGLAPGDWVRGEEMSVRVTRGGIPALALEIRNDSDHQITLHPLRIRYTGGGGDWLDVHLVDPVLDPGESFGVPFSHSGLSNTTMLNIEYGQGGKEFFPTVGIP